MSNPPRPLDALEATIRGRAESPNAISYTSKLLTGGVESIGAKVVEEARELVDAASEPGEAGRSHFVYEAADLVYHTLVLMRHRGVDLTEVEAELARRFGISGIKEKAGRTKQ
ncbi:MAG: phosphoribosyl-ATP diphosphatase [Pirellulales bacterium]